MRQIRGWTVLLAGVAYLVIGVVTARLAEALPWGGAKAWRLAAWLLSLAVFGMHFAIERRRRQRALDVAARIGLAVALGAFLLAAVGPFRSHWGEPSRVRLAVLSLLAWPILTGVPAFLVALIAGQLFDRVRARIRAST